MAQRRSSPFDLNFLASVLENARTGKGFNAFEAGEVASVLISATEWNPEVPRGEHAGLVWKAITDASSHQPITGNELAAALARAQKSFLALPATRFTLVAPLTVSPLRIHKAFELGGVRISANLPRAYSDARRSDEANIPQDERFPRDSIWATVPVLARTEPEAFHKASELLDFVRGCWNFYLNRQVFRSISFPRDTKPINKVLLGRAQSLHRADGAPYDGYWSDWFPAPEKRFSPSAKQWNGILRMHRNTARRLRRHPYGAALRVALVRYVRALDSPDDEATFLKLWGLAETLTNTGGSNYDVTIRRIQFLFDDRSLAKHLLEHLRLQRNQSVHGDTVKEDSRVLVYQAKGYVEALLDFHAGVGRQLASLEEAALMMDLPTDESILRRRIALLNRAIRYRA